MNRLLQCKSKNLNIHITYTWTQPEETKNMAKFKFMSFVIWKFSIWKLCKCQWYVVCLKSNSLHDVYINATWNQWLYLNDIFTHKYFGLEISRSGIFLVILDVLLSNCGYTGYTSLWNYLNTWLSNNEHKMKLKQTNNHKLSYCDISRRWDHEARFKRSRSTTK